MKRKRLLSLLVLLLTVATGLWAQDMKSTPLTMEVLTSGTIKVDMGTQTLSKGMKYKVNNGSKITITQTTTIDVQAGDKVQFYGNSNAITKYGARNKEISITGGTASVKVYGNIMSLVSEKNYPTVTTLKEYAFRRLFIGNTKLTDASGLLLPATEMQTHCYTAMFYNCSNLTAAPELPAMTLATNCYYAMFLGCTSLTAAPELPAANLKNSCYSDMFSGCSKLASVNCYAMDISATECTNDWLKNAGSSVTGTKTLTIIKDTPWTENSISGIPTGWTSNITYAVSLKDGTTDADMWTASVGQSSAKPLPIGGLNKDDAVNLNYSGRLKVEDVTATTDVTKSTTTANTWTIAAMPADNVEVSVTYYPQATAEADAVTANAAAKATTDVPLVTIDATKLTGATTLKYYVSTTETPAPAYDDQGWTDVVPTAEAYTEATTVYVWYYPVGTDEDVNNATATYSDGDMNATALPIAIGDAPTIYFDPAPVENVTITVGGTAATAAELQAGKIEKVQMGKTIQLTAATGYKFRSVVVNEKGTTTTAATVATNAAQAGATFTVATFDMPALDATATYVLVRDMAVSVTAYAGDDATATYRHRVEFNNNQYKPAGITSPLQVMALFHVKDVIDAQNPKDLAFGTDYTLSFLDADNNESLPTAFDFAPGAYTVKVTGIGNYDGFTESVNQFTLYCGYEVGTVAPGEFATFYRNEPLSADGNDIEIYTIKSVTGTAAVLTKLTNAPSNTPLLVFNKGSQEKSLVLIRDNGEPASTPDVYVGFQGTQTGTQLSASTDTQKNFIFNGKKLVYVKDAIAIPANKCWVEVGNTNARSLDLVFEEEENLTGIDSLTPDPSPLRATLLPSGGRKGEGSIYMLDGRKVTNGQLKKGIYIQNGKKTVIK